VRIAGVTWYGMETSYWVPAGLDFQRYTKIMDLVQKLGYNAIRLPFSNELVESNPVVREKIKANPQFRGMHALQVMDTIVRYAKRIGLKIILDNHVCRAERPNTVNDLVEARWYTKRYPESAWTHDWEKLARRYLHNDTVIGFDLRNEPHTNGPGPWDLDAYLHQGATWGQYNGRTNPASDWRRAAQRAGNASLSINPHLLMFVEGLQLYPDKRRRKGVNSYWWGSIMTPVRHFPVVFKVPHQLVYSPHDWGPWKWKMPWFKKMTYESLQRVWYDNWAFILDDPDTSYAAPIWIGEFGTCTDKPGCVDREKEGNQAQWFQFLLRYLKDHPDIGWSFFALNGTNARNSPANNGILTPRWNGVANQDLQAELAEIQS
jgi:endoglucanase